MSDMDHHMVPLRPWRAIDEVVEDASGRVVCRCMNQHVARAVVDAVKGAETASGWKHDAESFEADAQYAESRCSDLDEEVRDLRAKVAALEERLSEVRALVNLEGDAA